MKHDRGSKGRNTLAQPLEVWGVWGDLDDVGNKYVQCVQLRWKRSEPRGCWLLQFSLRSMRRLAVGHLSHWIIYASYMTILNGGVLANQRGVLEGQNSVCALFFYALCSVISCFHVAPPAYCISRKHRTYMLLWSWQHVEAVCSMQLFCQTGQTRGNRVSDKGSWLLVLVLVVWGLVSKGPITFFHKLWLAGLHPQFLMVNRAKLIWNLTGCKCREARGDVIVELVERDLAETHIKCIVIIKPRIDQSMYNFL